MGLAERWCKQGRARLGRACRFRDSAFVDDVAKTNCTAILHQRGLGNVRGL